MHSTKNPTIVFFTDLDAAVRPSLSQKHCIQVTVCINCTFKILFEYYCSCPGAERTQDSGAGRGTGPEWDTHINSTQLNSAEAVFIYICVFTDTRSLQQTVRTAERITVCVLFLCVCALEASIPRYIACVCNKALSDSGFECDGPRKQCLTSQMCQNKPRWPQVQG